MNTFPALQVTESGDINFIPECPVKPKNYFDGTNYSSARRKYFNDIEDYKKVLKKAIRYPVKNKEYAEYFLAKNNGYNKNTMRTEPGIYPYNGEVEKGITYLTEPNKYGLWCEHWVNLVEHKTDEDPIINHNGIWEKDFKMVPVNTPEKPDSSEYQKVCKLAKALKDELEQLRAENKELDIRFRNYVESSEKAIEDLKSLLRKSEVRNKELLEALKQAVCQTNPSPITVQEWKNILSKHSNL
jgi:hypothetical protein